jgi:hypothetical protein
LKIDDNPEAIREYTQPQAETILTPSSLLHQHLDDLKLRGVHIDKYHELRTLADSHKEELANDKN